jgi:dolichol-phosphate mannosyltransferase
LDGRPDAVGAIGIFSGPLQQADMNTQSNTLVIIATYNEMENLPRLTADVFQHAPHVQMLVIDDCSPDGTGRWCDERAARDERFHVIHRPEKLGLGTATVAGLRYAIEHGFDYAVVMDADLSHPADAVPALLGAMAGDGKGPLVDVVVGSRYAPGGRILGWPWYRRWMSRLVNALARGMLGLNTRDCSGAFRCYRTERLKQIDLSQMWSRGYSYLEELLWMLKQSGARIEEIPIVFTDRQHGRTKINSREAFETLWLLLRLGVRNHLRIR